MAEPMLDGLEVVQVGPGCWLVAWRWGTGHIGEYDYAWSTSDDPARVRAAILATAARLRGQFIDERA